jgi:hypothetical protein
MYPRYSTDCFSILCLLNLDYQRNIFLSKLKKTKFQYISLGCVGVILILVIIFLGSQVNTTSKNDLGHLNFIPHPSYGFIFSKLNEDLEINDEGFLGANIPKVMSPKYFNILVLGGTRAFTIIREGNLRKLAKKWSSKNGKKVRFYNTAVPGWGEIQTFINYTLLGQDFDGVIYINPKRQNSYGSDDIVSSNMSPSFEKLIYNPTSYNNWRKYFSLNYFKKSNNNLFDQILKEPIIDNLKNENRYWKMLVFLTRRNKQKLLGYFEKETLEPNHLMYKKKMLTKVQDLFVHLKENWGFKEVDET